MMKISYVIAENIFLLMPSVSGSNYRCEQPLRLKKNTKLSATVRLTYKHVEARESQKKLNLAL
jgi:hypothetical protein